MCAINCYNNPVKFRINYCWEDFLFLKRMNSTYNAKKKKDFKREIF